MASEAEETKPKGILRKGDDTDRKKKAGQIKLSADIELNENKPKKEVLVETSTGIIKKDSAGNIIEDRREKPRGERQQLKPKAAHHTSNDSINSISHSNDIISPSNDIIQPSDKDSIQHAPAPTPAPTPAAPQAELPPLGSDHEKDPETKEGKEKCIIS